MKMLNACYFNKAKAGFQPRLSATAVKHCKRFQSSEIYRRSTPTHGQTDRQSLSFPFTCFLGGVVVPSLNLDGRPAHVEGVAFERVGVISVTDVKDEGIGSDVIRNRGWRGQDKADLKNNTVGDKEPTLAHIGLK